MGRERYVIEEKEGEQRLFRRGNSITVLTLMDGSLAAQYEGEIFSMRESFKLAKPGKNKEFQEEEEKGAQEVKTPRQPAPDHPWRKYKIHGGIDGKSVA
jgi:hypothetical protein